MNSYSHSNKLQLSSSSSMIAAILIFSIFTKLSQADRNLYPHPEEYLAPHNAARALVGVAPIVWNETVAAYAQNYANTRSGGNCQLVHSQSNGTYGENLSWYGGPLLAKDAVGYWISEKPNFHYDTDTCVGGECRHYTAVVCRRSTQLGCASVRCDSGATFVICDYYPPGRLGEKPY